MSSKMSFFFIEMKTADATWKLNVAINLIPASMPERTYALAASALFLNAEAVVL